MMTGHAEKRRNKRDDSKLHSTSVFYLAACTCREGTSGATGLFEPVLETPDEWHLISNIYGLVYAMPRCKLCGARSAAAIGTAENRNTVGLHSSILCRDHLRPGHVCHMHRKLMLY